MGRRVGGGREGDAWRRHQLAIQRSRLGSYALSALLGAGLKLLGGLHVSWLAILAMVLVAAVTVGFFRALLLRVDDEHAPLARAFFGKTLPAWVVVDIATTSAACG
jgi:hypothetical protein